MRQVQVHGGATSKARASHEPFKEATEASAWGKAGVATGAAPGGLPGGVLGKESGVARSRFTCSLSEDLRPAANRGAIASSGPKVAAVGIASRHRGGEGLGLDYEVPTRINVRRFAFALQDFFTPPKVAERVFPHHARTP